jgi:hypothetical protein
LLSDQLPFSLNSFGSEKFPTDEPSESGSAIPPNLKVSIQPHALAFVTTRLLVNAVLGSHVVLTQGLSVAGLTFCPALTVVVAGHGSLGPSVWKLHNLQPSLKKSFWCTDSMCTFSASAVSTSLGQKAHLQKQLGSSN